MPENNREFFAQFLDDYYAESDEHLTLLRRGLLLLEGQIDNPTAARTLLDDLFRSFHTLKGISGMVGLTEAELLSHHMESYLRLLRQEEVGLDKPGIEVLIAGTTMLEKVIAARRNQENVPSIEGVISRLKAFGAESDLVALPTNPNDEHSTEPMFRAEPPAATDLKVSEIQPGTWKFIFTPSIALSEQGVNVNRVRNQLQEIGEIVRSTPLVENEGEISFEFIVITNADESVFANWALENLSYEPIAQATLIETSPSGDSNDSVPMAASAASMLASAGIVRVDLVRLDDLMRMIGELVSSRGQLESSLKSLRGDLPTAVWRKLQETSSIMGRQLRDLREGVIRVRMVQVGEIFERMKFVVRDLARENGKEVKLELIGQETEIDKFLVERMMDPLLHLVRNAVSHGLETPAARRDQNKPVEGRLTLRAATIGESILLEIADDGRGIDVEEVSARARAKQLISPEALLDNSTLLDVLCAPGFSTRDKADRESGRGIGMDVVRKTVAALGGTLSLETEKNTGTRFMIELPLTLAIAEALIAVVGDQKFAVPQSAVREVIEVERSSVKILENNEIISYRGGVLPLLRLSRLFELGEASDRPLHVFVIGSGLNALGIAVDRILGQREIVVRGINDPLVQVPGIAGATELGDERVVLILDVGALRNMSASA